MSTVATAPAPSAPPSAVPATPPVPAFEFDADFERKIAALLLRDFRFAKETLDYLKPEHFTNALDRNMAVLVQDFVRRYGSIPDPRTLLGIIKATPAMTAEVSLYADRLVEYIRTDLHEREYIREVVNDFCRRQALLLLASQIPDIVDKRDPKRWEKIEAAYRKATAIGVDTQPERYDYFANAASRKEMRESIASGAVSLGVSTGFPEINDQLYRRGYQRGGLTGIMAPAKRGKTALMLQSCVYGVLDGVNALYLSLEVTNDVLTDRMDACLTSTTMDSLVVAREDIEKEVNLASARPGRGNLYIECRPSNSFSTDQVERLIDSYLNDGHPLDIVFVDYIGILRMADPKDRYMSLGIAAKELRRIGGERNIAMVTGIQTNRGAVNAETAGADSIGESFAVVQDVDLLMSVNANEAEMASGVRRIHWAASRNEATKTISVQGDLETMQIIQRVLGVSA